MVQAGAPALLSHPVEVEHIEKVHATESQQHDPKLGGNIFDSFFKIGRLRPIVQEEKNKPQVDQVKTHHQEVIHRIGHLLVVIEGLQQKDSPILMKRSGYPCRHEDTDERVGQVDPDSGCHINSFRQNRFQFNPGAKAKYP